MCAICQILTNTQAEKASDIRWYPGGFHNAQIILYWAYMCVYLGDTEKKRNVSCPSPWLFITSAILRIFGERKTNPKPSLPIPSHRMKHSYRSTAFFSFLLKYVPISLSIGKNIFFYVIPITPTTNSAITIIATNIVQLAMISILLVRSLRTKRIRRQLSMKEQVWCVAGAERQQNRKITRIITTWAERVGPVDVPNRVSKKQVRKYFFVCLSAHMLFPYAASYEGNCIYMVRRLIWFSCPCIRMYRIRWWLKQASGEFKIMRVFFFIYY